MPSTPVSCSMAAFVLSSLPAAVVPSPHTLGLIDLVDGKSLNEFSSSPADCLPNLPKSLKGCPTVASGSSFSRLRPRCAPRPRTPSAILDLTSAALVREVSMTKTQRVARFEADILSQPGPPRPPRAIRFFDPSRPLDCGERREPGPDAHGSHLYRGRDHGDHVSPLAAPEHPGVPSSLR